MQAPLEGIRVVEVANYVAAPSAGALLADLGADVVKVEVPQGEIYRQTRPRHLGHKVDFDGSPAFQMDNRGKRSLALDLTNPAARAALLRVIDGCDVLLTNLLPERQTRYGLDPETLRKRQPGLIYASLTGYGRGGAEANRPGFDYAAYWARTGFMDSTREPDAPPAYLRPGTGDHAAGMSLVAGILAAAAGRPVYCCGPEGLLAAVEAEGERLGVPVHVERFSARPGALDGPDEAFEVELSGSGTVVAVPAGCSILDALEGAGIATLSSCREGTCGTCETGVLAGEPDHRDSLLTEEERASNEVMMLCVSRSRSPRLVLEL